MPDRRRTSCPCSVRLPSIYGSSELQRVGKYSFSYGPGDSFERWRQRQYLSQPVYNLRRQNLQFEACGHFNLATDRGAKTIGAAGAQLTLLQSYSAWCSKTIRTARSRISREYLVDLFMTPYPTKRSWSIGRINALFGKSIESPQVVNQPSTVTSR